MQYQDGAMFASSIIVLGHLPHLVVVIIMPVHRRLGPDRSMPAVRLQEGHTCLFVRIDASEAHSKSGN